MATFNWFGWVVPLGIPNTGNEDLVSRSGPLNNRVLQPSQLDQNILMDDVNNDGLVGDRDLEPPFFNLDNLGAIWINGSRTFVDELDYDDAARATAGTITYQGQSFQIPFTRFLLTDGRVVFTLEGRFLQDIVAATPGRSFDPNLITFARTGSAGTEQLNSLGDLTGARLSEFETLTFPCFSGAAMIATETGERPAREIRVGDRIPTRDNGVQIVRYVASRHLTQDQLHQNPDLTPIRIAAGALGDGLPRRDLVVSPQHALLVQSQTAELLTGESEVLVRAKWLLILPGVDYILPEDGIDYVHFLFDRHEIVFAEGSQTESLFLGDRTIETFDTEAETELRAIFCTLDLDGQHNVTVRLVPDGRTQTALAGQLRRTGQPAARARPPLSGPPGTTQQDPSPHHA